MTLTFNNYFSACFAPLREKVFLAKTQRRKDVNVFLLHHSSFPGRYSLFLLPVLLNIYSYCSSFSQHNPIDSLSNALSLAKDDTHKVNLLNNLSEKRWQEGVYDAAFLHAGNAKTLAEKLEFKHGIAASYNNIAIIYYHQGHYTEALKNHFAALKIEEEIGDKEGMAGSFLNIGSLELILNNFDSAKKYMDDALTLAKEIGSRKYIMDIYIALSELDSTIRNFEGAYSNYTFYSLFKDSLFSEKKSKEMGRLEMKHEFEMMEMKRQQEETERNRQLAVAVNRRNKLQYSGILIGIFVLFVCIFFVGKFQLPNWTVELSVFIPFLILFELLLVFLDPFLDKITGGGPVYKLLVNAGIAALIFPLHKYFERILKMRVFKYKNIAHGDAESAKKLTLYVGLISFSFLLNNYLWMPSFAQNKTLDSLLILLKTDKPDTSQVIHLYQLCDEYRKTGDYKKGLQYGNTALVLAKKMNYKRSMATTYNNLGNIYESQGNYTEALKNHFASLKIKEEIGDKKGIANSYNNLGMIYAGQGNYPEALKNYFTSLKIREEIGDKKGIAISYNNLGIIYDEQGNYAEALKNYYKSVKIKEELGDKKGVAYSHHNIGIIYCEQGNYMEALKNFYESLKIEKELGDKKGIAYSYNNIGITYKDLGNYPEALKNYFASLKIKEEIGDKKGITVSYINIGKLYSKLYNLKEAGVYFSQGLVLSMEIGSNKEIKDSYFGLARLDSIAGNFRSAYQNYKLASQYKDSLFSEEKSKEVGRLEMKHEFEMTEMKQRQEEEEKSRQLAAVSDRRNTLQYSGILIGVFGLFVFVFFMGRFNLPKWVVEISVFIPFLILFEFVLVLLDSHIEQISGGEPLYKLLLNTLLASLIFPIHSFFERLMKKRLMKNNKIEL